MPIGRGGQFGQGRVGGIAGPFTHSDIIDSKAVASYGERPSGGRGLFTNRGLGVAGVLAHDLRGGTAEPLGGM